MSSQVQKVQPKTFDMAVWAQERVREQVVPLLPGGEKDWPAFTVALRSAIIKDDSAPNGGALREAIQNNPGAALNALVKCTQLGLSLNPADQHFALVPYGGVVNGQPMYRGYQYLFQASGLCEGMGADVVYRREHDPSRPLRDPETGAVTHIPHDFERDSYPDSDIIGAYAWAKVKGRPKVSARVLGRANIEKRRATNKGKGPAWDKWYAEMCKAKAWQALFCSGELPLNPALLRIVREDLASEEGHAAAQVVRPSAAPRLAPPLTAEQPASSDPDWDAANQEEFRQLEQDPLPDAEAELAGLRKQVLALANAKKVSGAGLLTTIKFACGVTVAPSDLDAAQCLKVLDELRK